MNKHLHQTISLLIATLMVFTMGHAFTAQVKAEAEEVPIFHLVRFRDADGRLLHTEKVADETAVPQPPVPEIPAGMNAFLGWFLEGREADPEGYFRFTALIFEDTDLYAAFSEDYLIHFEDAFGKVVKSVLVPGGGSLAAPGDIAILSPEEGRVFTGGWHVKAAGGREEAAYDFGREVTSNFTLVPDLAGQYLVQFETNGDPVAPQAVEKGAAAARPFENPTRKGYIFRHWSVQEGGEPYDFSAPVTSDTTIHAVWNAEQVSYKVVYWLEKANIAIDHMNRDVENDVVDPGKFAFAYSETKQAEAGSTAVMTEGGVPKTAAFKAALLLTGSNAAAPYAAFYKSAAVEVAGDGSSVVNVYYTRNLYTLKYTWSAPANGTVTATLPGHDAPVTVANGASHTYAIQAKVGMDLNGVAPKIFSDDGVQQFVRLDNGVQTYVNRGWGPWSLSTFNPFTALYLSVSGDTYANSYDRLTRTATYQAKWETASSQHKTIRHVFVESLDQQSAGAHTPLASGRIADRLSIDKFIYLSGAETVIPESVRHFDLFSTSNHYWATTGDRQIANLYDGFTYYSVEKTGNWSNCYQWEYTPGDGLFYQLKYTGIYNRNDPVRYYFFSRNSYPITFNNTGHQPLDGVDSVKYEAPVAVYEPDTASLGLGDKEVFKGWFLDSDYTMPFDFQTEAMPAGPIELFARYEREDHTVTFLDGMGGREVDRAGVADGGTVARPDRFETGDYEDYGTFRGWYWELGGQVVPFNWNTRIRDDAVIFAVWSTDGFTVRYDLDGGDGETPVDAHTYEMGSAARAARISGVTKDGGRLLFAGWQRDGSDEIHYPGKIFTLYGDVRFVARYVPLSSTVSLSYYRNRDAGDGRMQQRIHIIGETESLPSATELGFVYEDHEFLGWSADRNAAAPDEGYRAGDILTVEGNTALYAVWKNIPASTTTTTAPTEATETSATTATQTTATSGTPAASVPDESTTAVTSSTNASTTAAENTTAPPAVSGITLYLSKILQDESGHAIGTGLVFQVQVLDSRLNVVATAAVTANGEATAVTGLASGEIYYVREMIGDYFTLAGYGIGDNRLIEKEYLIFRSTLSSSNVAGNIRIALTNVSSEADIEIIDPDAPLTWPDIDPGDRDIVEIVPEEVPLDGPSAIPQTGVSVLFLLPALILAVSGGILLLLKKKSQA